MTRQEARQSGLKYYVGVMCKRGHGGRRFVSDKSCVECRNLLPWRNNNPDRAKASQRQFYLNNQDVFRQRNRDWHRKNREKSTLRHNQWRKDNPEAHSVIRSRRYSRQKGAEGTYSLNDIHGLLSSQHNQCLCGVIFEQRSDYHIDHVVPISRGGSNYVENLQLLCAPCNLSKGSKTMIEWVQTRDSHARIR